MTVIVRADAGVELGSGHIVRCSSLLKRLGFDPESVLLLTRSLTPGLRKIVDSIGWQVRDIGNADSEESDARATVMELDDLDDVDLLVVDHYQLSAVWEQTVRKLVRRLVVIDDLADRRHTCDVLIDPTITDVGSDRHMESAKATTMLLGPRYALLDPVYDTWIPRERNGSIRTWLVYLGGATSASDVLPLISAFDGMDLPGVTMTIVLGRAFVGANEVRSAAESLGRVRILDWTDDMPTLLTEADCAIGAPGGAQWERCAMGVPTFTVLTTPNQENDAAAFESVGATSHLGPLASMTSERWGSALDWGHSHPAEIRSMSLAAAEVVAGRETAWASAVPLILGQAGDL